MTIEEIEKAYTQGRKQGWADKDAWIKERVRMLKDKMKYKILFSNQQVFEIIDKVFEIK